MEYPHLGTPSKTTRPRADRSLGGAEVFQLSSPAGGQTSAWALVQRLCAHPCQRCAVKHLQVDPALLPRLVDNDVAQGLPLQVHNAEGYLLPCCVQGLAHSEDKLHPLRHDEVGAQVLEVRRGAPGARAREPGARARAGHGRQGARRGGPAPHRGLPATPGVRGRRRALRQEHWQGAPCRGFLQLRCRLARFRESSLLHCGWLWLELAVERDGCNCYKDGAEQ
eukprot:CAMPEP_0179180606 /NCGR_PEP_ID=MMETSP0796-20121207/89416_1 /TAXON_ID=73915 /ORGANISM="Pyrodinium bahamense, Strain pbaha01" /LENGTH=222 /DNA_ID=CAMNT_0020884321 /DNA_START=291 /DNA_END=960 /DNA_ORIENTATION=+